MKLAAALTERADIQRKISDLTARMNANAKHQEGTLPAEDPNELLKEFDSCVERLEELIRRINLTNSSTKVEGETITELIAKRDCLNLRINTLRQLLNAASDRVQRYSKSDILILSSIDVVKRQKELDLLSKQSRQLDEKIQTLNWTTELM